MIFPKNIEKGDIIGVCAPSGGVTEDIKIKRTKNGALNLRNAGYEVAFSDSVFKADERGVSASGKQRADEFNAFIKNDKVSAIISAGGGDFLFEMLEYVDWDALKKNPKWFQGYSDNMTLLYPIVTKCDIAAIYGCGIREFGMQPWEKCVKDSLGVLDGSVSKLDSYDFHETERHEYVTGLEGYFNDQETIWVNGKGEEKVEMSGRLLGGCLDVLVFLIGTKYDGTKDFIQKYADDGIVWALESFAMADVDMVTHLWQMKELGYFENAKGFVFGRPCMYEHWTYDEYKDAVMSILGELDVPVVFDADLGHMGPQFPWIMGAKAKVTSEAGKGTLEYLY